MFLSPHSKEVDKQVNNQVNNQAGPAEEPLGGWGVLQRESLIFLNFSLLFCPDVLWNEKRDISIHLNGLF